MNKFIIIIQLIFILSSCNNNIDKIKILTEENARLKKENEKYMKYIENISFTPYVDSKKQILKLGEEYKAKIFLGISAFENPPITVVSLWNKNGCISKNDTIKPNLENPFPNVYYNKVFSDTGEYRLVGKIDENFFNKKREYFFECEIIVEK